MVNKMIVTEDIFRVFLRGCGGRHVFCTHEQILKGESLEKEIQMAEGDYGINAWHKNIGIVTLPATEDEVDRFDAVLREMGYHAIIHNREQPLGTSHTFQFCELILMRIDVPLFTVERV